MKAGVPVLTSNIGSMKEVAGEAALLIDPSSAESIAQGLSTLLTDSSRRSDLIAKGKERAKDFSWKKTVDRFLAVLG
jgi:glycosyltransferase involved in cell wall biosynthesis